MKPGVHISIHPGYQFGRPVIAETRTPTSSLAGCVFAGDPVDAVADDYGASREEVLLACWYELDLLDQKPPSRLGKRDSELVERCADWYRFAFEALAGYDHAAYTAETLPDPPVPLSPVNRHQ